MKNNNNKTIQEIMKDVHLSKNYMDITFEGVLLGQAVLQKSLSVKKNQRDGQAKGVATKLKKTKRSQRVPKRINGQALHEKNYT